MASSVTASKLRQNVYRLLDRVLETGEPIAIKRKGRFLKIVPATTGGKLRNLIRRKTTVGRPEDLVHLDWSRFWKPRIR